MIVSVDAVTEAFDAFRRRLPPRPRIYVAGCSGEPLILARALRGAPQLAAGVTFLGVWIPGVNETDWAGLHPDARAETMFLSAALAPSFAAKRTAFRPLSYRQAVGWLAETPLDAAVVMVAPPRGEAPQEVSLGVSADFSGLIAERTDVPLFAVVNEAMPVPADGVTIPLARLSQMLRIDEPLPDWPSGAVPPVFGAIGRHVAGLIEDGDTLQFGLGNVQRAVLEALSGHRRLRVHSGMVSDGLLPLLDQGVIAEGPGAVTTGVAIGTGPLYARAAQDPRFRFRPVSFTHAEATLAAKIRLKAINSAMEVDLFGQVNAEFIGTKQVSGAGGLGDFLRGAAASPGGRGIVALAATAKTGSVSRIVPRLREGAVSIGRADADLVVTENGVADLRYKTIDERAEALIGIADRAFQAELAAAWQAMRSAM